jgi:hypothetical protein
MPLAGYYIYNHSNELAVLWRRTMPIAKEQYFSYALPAVSGFVLMLCLPLFKLNNADEGWNLINKIKYIKSVLKGKHYIGLILIFFGLVSPFIVDSMPVSLQYLINLIYFSSFAGILYIFYSGSFPFKRVVTILFWTILLLTSIRAGMFTVIAYMGMTIFSFFFLGKKTSLMKKVTFSIVAIFTLFIIQSVKPAYRMWLAKSGHEANKLEVFTDLAIRRVSSSDNLFNSDAFFPVYYRANHGFNLSLVMKRFPHVREFDNGSHLFVLIVSSFVPRFLWEDKPEAGGVGNMKYYTGYTIKGWSTNVGPIGEAYASFGKVGGIFYMLILGLFIRYTYVLIFRISDRWPLVLLWIAFLYYQISYSGENDTLQILNSFFKSGLFLYILYRIFPVVLRPSD